MCYLSWVFSHLCVSADNTQQFAKNKLKVDIAGEDRSGDRAGRSGGRGERWHGDRDHLPRREPRRPYEPPQPTREASHPPNRSAEERPKINLLPRGSISPQAEQANAAPAQSTDAAAGGEGTTKPAKPARINPFGEARPVDTNAWEARKKKEEEEKRRREEEERRRRQEEEEKRRREDEEVRRKQQQQQQQQAAASESKADRSDNWRQAAQRQVAQTTPAPVQPRHDERPRGGRSEPRGGGRGGSRGGARGPEGGRGGYSGDSGSGRGGAERRERTAPPPKTEPKPAPVPKKEDKPKAPVRPPPICSCALALLFTKL
jgi:hypothetical protein